ncbi:MAG: hypothetical protein ACREOE_17050 [Gemmatimonadales bacterium]
MQVPQHATDREPIYRLIRIIMAGDAVLGLLLMIFGPWLTGIAGLRLLGAGLCFIGVGLYLFFGRLAMKARRS